ncbi:uncharacterized protein LOC117605231 isoform X2 [Osmia lignaria lignaria]|uniref:uncharacterized protein LOC117605231 isoform X2 n=1 Tax=Osmia lignaria lignaria TaxID=1437193 RepID=UPI00402B5170
MASENDNACPQDKSGDVQPQPEPLLQLQQQVQQLRLQPQDMPQPLLQILQMQQQQMLQMQELLQKIEQRQEEHAQYIVNRFSAPSTTATAARTTGRIYTE